MESKKVVASGSIIPSIVDVPLDIRTRINTINDIYNIELPFIGMIVYVIDEDKYYKIKTLKSKEIGLQSIENAAVDTFEEFLKLNEDKTKLSKTNPTGAGYFSMNRIESTEIGIYSSTLGKSCEASGDCSHAEGWYTIAAGEYQHVQGRYNIEDTENRYAHIVGSGTNPDSRCNICTLDWNGNAWFQGDVFIKGTLQDDGQKLVTEDMVIALQQEIAELRAIIEELKNK